MSALFITGLTANIDNKNIVIRLLLIRLYLYEIHHPRSGHSRQVMTSPPWPMSTLPGKTFSLHGSSRMAANASDLGLSHPGMIAGSYPTGSGPLRKRFHTIIRVSSSKAQAARHSATQVS